MEILLYTWGADGNMLLNIGPRGDGSLNPEEVERLEQIADWWGNHGEESIRGSRGGPYLPGPWGVATCKGNRVFLHVFRWPSTGALCFPALPERTAKAARRLVGGNVQFTANAGGFSLAVAKEDREPIVTTVEVTFDGPTLDVVPLPVQHSLTWDAKLTASHSTADIGKVTDRDATTSWHASLDKGERACWIDVMFDEPTTIGSVVIGRGDEWSPRQGPELQIPDGADGWKTVFAWKAKWEPVKFLPEAVTVTKVRLRLSGTSKFCVTEFELYPPM